MADIFIAFSRADLDIASGLKKEISKWGWSVWMDENLEVGESLTPQIISQIRHARVIIVLWTETAINSEWIFAETTLARGENKQYLPIVWGDRIKPPDIFEQVVPIYLKIEQGKVEWRTAITPIKQKLESIFGPFRKLEDPKSLRLMTWNLAGAKHLALGPDLTLGARKKLTSQLKCLVKKYNPHVVMLQEYAQFAQGSTADKDLLGLIEPSDIPEYKLTEIPLISNEQPCHPEKWQRFIGWHKPSLLTQGMAMLWRSNLCVGNFWDFKTTKASSRLTAEIVRMETGLYTGNRDTEPRAAVVAHFVFGPNHEPRDVLIVNVHLTTLKNEREGKPFFDELGNSIRMSQIDVLLNGIVSRYNTWWDEYDGKGPRKSPVWILAGDFNCTPNSQEIRRIIQSQFMNLNPNPKWGSRGDDRELNVDYIFAGPKYRSLKHRTVERKVTNNLPPIKTVLDGGIEINLYTSDHFPVFARLPLKD